MTEPNTPARIIEPVFRTLTIAVLLAALWVPGQLTTGLLNVIAGLVYPLVLLGNKAPAALPTFPPGTDERLIQLLKAHDGWRGPVMLLGFVSLIGGVLTIYFRSYITPYDKAVVVGLTILIPLFWILSFARAHRRRAILASTGAPT